jgi:hypothetical protein
MRMEEQSVLEARNALWWVMLWPVKREAGGGERRTQGEEGPNKSKICRRCDVHAGTCSSQVMSQNAHVSLGWARSAQFDRLECPL